MEMSKKKIILYSLVLLATALIAAFILGFDTSTDTYLMRVQTAEEVNGNSVRLHLAAADFEGRWSVPQSEIANDLLTGHDINVEFATRKLFGFSLNRQLIDFAVAPGSQTADTVVVNGVFFPPPPPETEGQDGSGSAQEAPPVPEIDED
ncbi:hypothetical protein FWH13_03795 [Candidatus Saccharibacteria bacterium]|nr:hypothetical protein [Candidatus Saccharibacteria bacterium]